MKTFEATEISLAGPRLVEASAGTGKTHAITTLVVRLVVERGITVDQILVVTFTEAATAELRTRIRARLGAALSVAAGETPGDPELASIVARSPQARTRLAVALTNIDRAAVFTIHGFCHRTLLDSAFDSGVRFDVELLTDTQVLRDEVLLDFWTARLATAELAVVESLRAMKVSTAQAADLVDRVTRAPTMPVLPADAVGAPAPSEQVFSRAFEVVKRTWDRGTIEAMLVESSALSGVKYRQTHVRSWCHDIDAYVRQGSPSAPASIDKNMQRLSASALRAGVKKDQQGREPRHPFFDACETLVVAAQSYDHVSSRHALGFQQELVAFVRRELPRRKERLGVMGFDDLLMALEQALTAPLTGERLARAVRRRYPVALIDEFQDTDPTQWSIFRTLYGRGDVVLIGDPKQAIYGFRGADVFAYLAAAEHVPEASRFTMHTCWRSDPSLIRAVGAIYARLPTPFAVEAIRHVVVGPRPGAHDELEGAAPLSFLFVPRGDAKRVTGEPLKRLPDAVAAHIQRSLTGEVSIQGIRLEPADIAVLTRTNRQAFEVQRALSTLGVHSVVLGDQSVFHEEQPEARELSLVLAALVEPTSNTALRAALTTELLGVDARELADMDRDEDAWDEWVELFRQLSELWHRRGFVQMFRTLMRRTDTVQRLLGLEAGERRVTNLLHLMELLQTAASGQHLGPAALVGWLNASRRPGSGNVQPEATQIRLESDARAVRITTVHRSKGLEYAVVYCPYLWDGKLRSSADKSGLTFHDPDDDRVLKLDLERDSANQAHAERERYAENLRLMYVALTRAKHRCVVVWGALGLNWETSPLGFLLHASPLDGGDVSVAAVKERLGSLADADMLSEIESHLQEHSNIEVLALDDIGVGEPAALPAPRVLQAREMTGRVHAGWRTASFSELTADRSRGGHEHGLGASRDRDVHVVAPGSEEVGDEAMVEMNVATGEAERITLHAFPRGPQAGDFFHDVLEHLDFTNEAELAPIVQQRLVAHGYALEHREAVVQALAEVLDTPLPCGGKRKMRLRDVPRADRLDELEFYFPVANPSTPLVPRGAQLSLAFSGALGSAMSPLLARGLAEPFIGHRSPELEESYGARVAGLGFAPLEGFLKGYIDLVFQHAGRWYVVDYKSNHLGESLADYGPENLRRAMSHGHYYLQAHLYAVAVHRLLQLRLDGYRYERHFGGVLYLFLKGMRPGSPHTGVFFEKPPAARIEQLSEILQAPPNVGTADRFERAHGLGGEGYGGADHR